MPALVLPARNSTQQQPGTPASHAAHQWLYIYDKGKVIFPSIAITSSLLYSYAAYAVRNTTTGRTSRSGLYLTAATLVLMIAPCTAVLIVPINKKLDALARRDDGAEQRGDEGEQKLGRGAEEEARREKQDDEFPSLIAQWSQMNVVRGLFPLLGAALGAATSFGLL
jgi:hypothetical protein